RSFGHVLPIPSLFMRTRRFLQPFGLQKNDPTHAPRAQKRATRPRGVTGYVSRSETSAAAGGGCGFVECAGRPARSKGCKSLTTKKKRNNVSLSHAHIA